MLLKHLSGILLQVQIIFRLEETLSKERQARYDARQAKLAKEDAEKAARLEVVKASPEWAKFNELKPEIEKKFRKKIYFERDKIVN